MFYIHPAKAKFQKDNMKRVLILTYYYPPTGGVPVMRIFKLSKYLTQFGWQPIILTAEQNTFVVQDENLLDELPENVIIYRTRPNFTQKLIAHIRYLFRKGNTDPHTGIHRSPKASQLYTTFRFIRNFLSQAFYFPDDFIGWRKIVNKQIAGIIQDHKIDLILSSSPPHSIHLAALDIKKKYNIPWIADFRDPWSLQFDIIKPLTPIHRFIGEYYEKKIVSNADAILNVSPTMSEHLITIYPFLNQDKVITFMNGYDGQDFQIYQNRKKDKSKFIITYVGTFYLRQSPITFYDGVAKFLLKNPAAKSRFLVQIVGKSQNDYEEYPSQIGIADNVLQVGFVPHQRLGQYLANSDILLLLVYGQKNKYNYVYTGKLFEYLPWRKPILLLSHQGVCTDFILQNNIGKVVALDDEEGLVDILAEFFQKWEKHISIDFGMSQELTLQYERKNQTQKLACIFNRICR
jgi:glycosyltransferase involved in cell wall biosynthesis